jgi:hypothetical protein
MIASSERASVPLESGCPHPLASGHTWWLLGLVLLLGTALRLAYYDRPYGHPDEPITVEVVGYMRTSGDWDTNWAKANLEPLLKYDQYNFSSHLYGTYFFYRAAKLWPGAAEWQSAVNGLLVYRFFSVLLAVAAVVQTWLLARKALTTSGAGLATALVAVAPLLVQDAHYARPEAFVTVLTLAVIALCWTQPTFATGRVLLAALLLGVLVAAKVSMLLLGFVLLGPIWAAAKGTRLSMLALTLLAMVAGFAIGAPGAVAHPTVFLNGVRYLTTHYSGLHPPHSHPDGGIVADLLLRYTGATFGWTALAAFGAGCAVLAQRRRWSELVLLAGPVAVFAGFFATRSVFFERNVSHVAPLFLIVAALGGAAVAGEISRRLRLAGRVAWVAPAVVAVLLLWRPLDVSGRMVGLEFSGRASAVHAALEREVRARFPEAGWLSTLFLTTEPFDEIAAHFRASAQPLLVRVSDYDDAFTREHLRQFGERFRAEEVAEDPGTFPDLPPCTLLTYLRSRERYFLVRGVR